MRLSLLFLLSYVHFSANAQSGTLEGFVSESEKNIGIGNASIEVRESSTAKVTNHEGRFTLKLTTGNAFTLKVTSVGFQPKEITGVEVKAGQVTTLHIILDRQAKTENAIVVRATARKETVNAMIAYQKNASTVAQVISSESIKRSPDRNTGEVLKRVSGTSIQDGKYLVVRGLADRYNQAMLNGVLLSSTEPDRKTFSFDIFPSSVVDNIIVNKAFVPELPGEWAGGIIQVNTKDVPARNFFQVQIGTGFNVQTLGGDFYTYHGGKTDFLGYDDGSRGLSSNFPTKGVFNNMNAGEKTKYGLTFSNVWAPLPMKRTVLPLLNQNIQITGGFRRHLGKNLLSAVMGVNYNRSNKRLVYQNSIYSVQNNQASLNFDYYNTRYSRDVLAGAIGTVALEMGRNHKLSFRNILNVNAANYSTLRSGKDYETNPEFGDNIRATELAFKANTFFNTQLGGDHNFPALKSKFNWYGSFNILDQYIPDQRRLQYNQDDPADPNSPYSLLIGASRTSQKSGSRYYGFLNDYNYTAGANLTHNFTIGGLSQSVKGGYMFQVKDRLFNSRPFAVYLPSDNPTLRHLDASFVFSPENFGDGFDNKFAFNEISDARYSYVANSILNAGYIQFDNNIWGKLRFVWGLRIEHFDQVVGSMKRSDPRHFHSKKTDFLPGLNLTYKLRHHTNIRLSGSQTVIRPEFRELSSFAFYDFDLGATITGEPKLERTRVTNADLRYELYPGSGEMFTVGVFYKFFSKPIELYFNQSGAGSSSTFNYINAQSARSYGIEMEFRKKLGRITALRNFVVQGNLSYIYNRVDGLNRPMQGQSPYLLNLGLQYDIAKHGLSSTLLINQIGRRIYYVGNSTSNGTTINDSYPPVWEAPRAIIDFQLAKKVIRNKGELKLNISDILNREATFYHDLNNNRKFDRSKDALAISRKYGANLSLSFSYNF